MFANAIKKSVVHNNKLMRGAWCQPFAGMLIRADELWSLWPGPGCSQHPPLPPSYSLPNQPHFASLASEVLRHQPPVGQQPPIVTS